MIERLQAPAQRGCRVAWICQHVKAACCRGTAQGCADLRSSRGVKLVRFYRGRDLFDDGAWRTQRLLGEQEQPLERDDCLRTGSGGGSGS